MAPNRLGAVSASRKDPELRERAVVPGVGFVRLTSCVPASRRGVGRWLRGQTAGIGAVDRYVSIPERHSDSSS
jgi:hypothetical protein